MTDLDAACYLKELKAYNLEGTLSTPQNDRTDTIWDCAIGHAIRALLERSGLKESDVCFSKNPNGSFDAHVSQTEKEETT